MKNKEIQDGIIITSNKTLSKYVGEKNISLILDKIKEDLDKSLNQFLSENNASVSDFPVEFENDLGKWKIKADGTTYFQPKVALKHIECNVTITKSNISFDE